jgi:hypothetical protein
MLNYFDGEFNGIKRWGESQYLDEEESLGLSLCSFHKSPNLEQDLFFEDYHNDYLREKESDNNIESNQNLSQKKTSDKSEEKEKGNNKNDEKPNIEISKANNNENGNSDTIKEYIENNNDIINNKEKTQEIKDTLSDINQIGKKRGREKLNRGKYKLESLIKKVKTFIFRILVKYVNSFGVELKKIDNKIIKDANSKLNKDLLDKKLEDILSLNISAKYKNIKNKEYNKEIIGKIYKENNQNVIDILKMTLKDFINNFKENPKLKGFYDNFIENMRIRQKQSDDYIKTFEYYFKKYCEICEKRKERKESKK